MNINLKFLLCGAAMWLFPQYAAAQCAVTDCQQLGYTSLKSCTSGLKCPFGEYWACPEVEEKAVLGECTGYAKNCAIGQMLNSDGTCSNDKVSGKTPIAVVVYIGSDNCGQALALQNLGNMAWSTENVDIPTLANYIGGSAEEKSFDSCGNTQEIIKFGNAGKYPAAWAAVNYAPSVAPGTKGKWCLPAVGVADLIGDNFDKINSGLSTGGGEKLLMYSFYDNRYWSSSESADNFVWFFHFEDGFPCRSSLTSLYKSDSRPYVRPVIEF